jgi:hypothetical protein
MSLALGQVPIPQLQNDQPHCPKFQYQNMVLTKFPFGINIVVKTGKILELLTGLVFLVVIGWSFPGIHHTHTKGKLGR